MKTKTVQLFFLMMIIFVLAACSGDVNGVPEPHSSDQDIQTGRRLLASYGCGSCHSIQAFQAQMRWLLLRSGTSISVATLLGGYQIQQTISASGFKILNSLIQGMPCQIWGSARKMHMRWLFTYTISKLLVIG